jgi:TolB-like protein
MRLDVSGVLCNGLREGEGTLNIGRALGRVVGLVFVGLFTIRPTVAFAITVAVVPFDNGGPAEMDGLSVGLQSMVTTDLSAASAITVVERARLQDLLAEMELGEKGVLDPATAVQIGKVSGATHVVAGSFTVVGDQMRLDARLAEVGTGTITVAAEQSGERDAFFELEKALVKSLLAALGAELSPKERAAVSRLHTADFDALKRFGEGVALYDADRYAEAIAVLEEVARSDTDFKLAAVTLADVEQVRDAAEKKAQAVRLANAEAAFVVHQQDARAEAELVEELQSLLKDDALDWRRKATLNLILSWALQPRGGLHALSRSADEFALARRSERAFQAYWSLVREQVPAFWPLHRDPHYSLRKGAAFELDYNLARWFPEERPEERFARQGMWSCEHAGLRVGKEELERLWVPARRRLDLHLELLQAAATCEAVDKRHDALLDVAKAYMDLGEVGDAVAILDQLTKESTDEGFLRQVAYQAERLSERQAVLGDVTRGSLEDELLRIGKQSEVPDSIERLRSDLEYHVRAELPFSGPMFVGGVPVWRVASRGAKLVGSGRRASIDETDALVYYRPAGMKPKRDPAALHVIGGVPMASGTASVTIDFEPHEDFYRLPFAIRSWTGSRSPCSCIW